MGKKKKKHLAKIFIGIDFHNFTEAIIKLKIITSYNYPPVITRGDVNFKMFKHLWKIAILSPNLLILRLFFFNCNALGWSVSRDMIYKNLTWEACIFHR